MIRKSEATSKHTGASIRKRNQAIRHWQETNLASFTSWWSI